MFFVSINLVDIMSYEDLYITMYIVNVSSSNFVT